MLCFYSQRKLKVPQYSMIKGATLKLGKLKHLICVNHNMLLYQLAHHMCKLIVSKPNIVCAIPLCLLLSHLYKYWINEIDHFSCLLNGYVVVIQYYCIVVIQRRVDKCTCILHTFKVYHVTPWSTVQSRY